MKQKFYHERFRIRGITLCFLIVGCCGFSQLKAAEGNLSLKDAGDLLIPIAESISGRVVDENGEPLPGVTIIVQGTSVGTVTDIDGKYAIEAEEGAVLVFSFVGYETNTRVVGSNSVLDISMQVDATALDEIVVVGYGTQKKAELTSAISTMKSENILTIPTSNLSNVLAGRLSGTFVRSSTGTPGVASEIRIRGTASWNGGSPVYVIDGVVRNKTSFDALDANEVEEISVLKDAASAAIYGSRATNGVILVTTKRGKEGKIQVQYSSLFSTERTGQIPSYMPFEDGLAITQAVNGGLSDEEIQWVLETNPEGMNTYNEAFQNPTNQKHAISVSGGGEKVSYYFGGSFYDEKGFLPNVWYKKYNLRGHVSAEIANGLTAELNLSNSYGKRNRFNFTYDYGSADLNNLWGKLLYNNVFAPRYIEGKPVNPGWLGNEIEMMRNGGYWKNDNQLVDALVSLKYDVPFVKGLSARVNYSQNISNSFIKNFAKKQELYNFKTTGANNKIYTNEVISTVMSGDPGREYIGNENTKANSYQFNTQINFDRKFGEHQINATAVYEQYEYQSHYFNAYQNNFPLFPTDQFFAASKNTSDWSLGGSESQDGRLSYIGRVNYSYADRYFFSSSVRRDGSIKFAPDKRWGWFPSVSAGWMLSKENFYTSSNIGNSLNMLKLRASFGSSGNDEIGGWGWLEQFNIQNSSYYMGNPGAAFPRLAYGGISNPDLTWEKSHSYNVGVDAVLFKNISLTAEFWKRHTFDILGGRIMSIPSEFGGSLPNSNYGVVDSKGMEFELGYSTNVGKDFSYDIKGTFGYATTEVIVRDAAANALEVDNPVGRTLSYGTGYQDLGILKTQADLDNLPQDYRIFGTVPELGMMNFSDLNGPQGIPDGIIDSYDRIILGEYMGANNAPISYGLQTLFTYKFITVDMLFAGLAGFKITYNDAWSRNFGGGGKVPAYHEDSWSEDNPNGSHPKLYPWGDSRAQGYVQTSTYNTYNGSFLRMKYLNIGFNIPESVYSKAGITRAQVFVSGTNLFNISKFKFYDPELSQFMSYPIMKSYSLGLNVQF